MYKKSHTCLFASLSIILCSCQNKQAQDNLDYSDLPIGAALNSAIMDESTMFGPNHSESLQEIENNLAIDILNDLIKLGKTPIYIYIYGIAGSNEDRFEFTHDKKAAAYYLCKFDAFDINELERNQVSHYRLHGRLFEPWDFRSSLRRPLEHLVYKAEDNLPFSIFIVEDRPNIIYMMSGQLEGDLALGATFLSPRLWKRIRDAMIARNAWDFIDPTVDGWVMPLPATIN